MNETKLRWIKPEFKMYTKNIDFLFDAITLFVMNIPNSYPKKLNGAEMDALVDHFSFELTGHRIIRNAQYDQTS